MRGNTINTWLEYIYKFVEMAPKESIHRGDYNINHALLYFDTLDKIDLEDFGYLSVKQKLETLRDGYLNEGSINRAKERLDELIKGSINISLINKEKKYTKQDHCMVAMVIFKKRNKYEVTVFYRATEFCKKFLADLVLLREILVDYLCIIDYKLVFFITKLIISPSYLYIPLLQMDQVHLKKILRDFAGYKNWIDKMEEVVQGKKSSLKSLKRHYLLFKKNDKYNYIIKTLERYHGAD